MQTLGEVVILFEVIPSPGHFGKGGEPRKRQVFGLFGIGDIFRPELSLRTEDVSGLVGGEFFGDRIVIINVPQGEVSPR